MKKTISLLRASMSEGMSFFRISGRNRSRFMKVGVPIIVGVLFMIAMGGYGYMMMEPLMGTGMEFVVLTLFVAFAAIFMLMEGIYKASGLLFNCRDDDMVLALPIKKSTVLLIRIMKFYLFEAMVNALFLAPVMLVYGVVTGAPVIFYVVSAMALLVLPILPIVISCVIGGLIAFFATKFRFKNLVQIVLTTIVLLVVLFMSYNLQEIMQAMAQNAGKINDVITLIYYPAGQYVDLVRGFEGRKLLVFVVVNAGLLLVMVGVLGKVYYKINSRVKVVKGEVKKHEYKISRHRPVVALVRKEIGKFVSSPVFVINAGFGLVLFVVVCVLGCINADGLMAQVDEMGIEGLSGEKVMSYIPAVLFGLVFMMSMMTSITSSMISLEGKSFNTLKSLPVSPMLIIVAKVLAATVVMVPVFLLGDLVVFAKFGFDVWQMLMIVASSVVMPMVAELVGIMVNLKFPKMDAKDDVEVVKQSMSSLIAVFTGLAGSVMMAYIIYNAFMAGMSATMTMGAGLVFGLILLVLLMVYLKKWGVKDFNAIDV